MAYSRITGAKNGAKSISYVFSSKPHKNGKLRNVLKGAIGFLPEKTVPYLKQCERLWSKASSRNKTQIRRLIVSFSPQELPVESPDSAATALEIGMQIAKRGYDGFPAMIGVQNDGNKGIWHIHILVVNVNVRTHKGFSDDQTKYWYLRRISDEVCKEHFGELDHGKGFDRYTQSERAKREDNEKRKEENKNLPSDEQKELIYIWRDDLKARVRRAMEDASNYDDFLERLEQNGVHGEYRNTKKNGEFMIYELKDESGFTDKIPANLKSKSYKMGTGYGLEALYNELAKKNEKPEMNATFETVDTGDNVTEFPVFDYNEDILETDKKMYRPYLKRVSGKKSCHEIKSFSIDNNPDNNKVMFPRKQRIEVARMIDVLNEDAMQIGYLEEE